MVMTSSKEAKVCRTQHKTPCHDCPWRLKSLPGWLGGTSKEEWLEYAHSETVVPCHTKIGPQCAGIAQYRANVCKTPRFPDILILPKSDKVFDTPNAFLQHHTLPKDTK